MISWIVIVILVICGIVAIKMNHFRHRIFILLLVLFAVFLYGTFAAINSMNELELNTSEGIWDAAKLYVGWLGNGFKNLKTITGNAIDMDWGSTNGTLFNKVPISPEIK
tara:strand:+ start:39 stop:365 length:327 start_codon:yes stop_codon:yes gene_type:complete